MIALKIESQIPNLSIETVQDFINSYSLEDNEYEIEYYLLGKYSRNDALAIEKRLLKQIEKKVSSIDRAYEIIGSMRKKARMA